MDRKRELEIVREMAARRRKFALPGIQDLSREAERAVRGGSGGGAGGSGNDGSGQGAGGPGNGGSGGRPAERERYLIVGGPGTGKTVVCLIRALRHHRLKEDYQFLVRTHLLHRASRQQYRGELASDTWETWLESVFSERTHHALPRIPAEIEGDYAPIDWKEVQRLTPSGLPVDQRWLIIDEGQDMPPQFYRVLFALGFRRFFVAADQNQQITEQHSSRQNIEDELNIDTEDVIELTHNCRNSAPVATLARAFYTGDPASPPVELPSGSGPTALLCDYHERRFGDICRRIVKRVDRYPAKLVGVIAPNNEVRQRYLKGLRGATGGLDNRPPTIATFYGQHRPDVRFDEGGILVINAQACKGLEFDVVVLADIDRHRTSSSDLDAVRKLFYVMVARAREQVILLRRRSADSRIEEILPDDPDVLQRVDLL